VLSAKVYNQVYTMHGVTMVFLVIMPMAAAFANYLLPLQIGARDVAFPRLNALSFWLWLFGALFLNSSGCSVAAPTAAGSTMRRTRACCSRPGTASTSTAWACRSRVSPRWSRAVNLITTVINMRAPGMTWWRVPVFTWITLVVQFLLLFAVPVITVALFLLTFDRSFGSTFFDASKGGDPMLWQHLFWIFGHPEVYIIILPSFGIVSEVIPVFSRKPIFGYRFMVFSGIAIGFMGWGVWAHHMFASGMGPYVGDGVLGGDDVHRRADRREDPELVGHHVGRSTEVHTAMLFAVGAGGHVHHRRPVGCDPRVRPGRHAADRHLLHRGALPLRALRRRPARPVRWHLLLVAEDVRLHAERALGKIHFWISFDRLQPDVRPDAHPRPGRACPAVSRPTTPTRASTSGT
jgi:hypothetical protein